MSNRLQDSRHENDFVAVLDPELIYVLMRKREEFDRIALPVKDHGENERGHVLSKSLDHDGVYIVFQFWLKERTIEAIRADIAAEVQP